MKWIVLTISALFEAVWAIALDRSEGLTQLIPTVIFIVGIAVSLGGLSYAMKSIPVSIAYAIWVGIGAATTVLASIFMGIEDFSYLKLLFIFGIIGSVIGLKFAAQHDTT
jgi:quaternary ammonium compound-resistance protein SugE